MFKFLLTLHVLAAVLLIGPFVLAGYSGARAIRRLDVVGARRAAGTLGKFSGGSLLVALLGFAVLGVSDRFTFRTPWIIISITLWVVAMGIATGYTAPALRRAAKAIAEWQATAPPELSITPADGDGPDSGASATTGLSSQALQERLNGIIGQVIGSGTVVLLAFICITVLMVVRPFGR